MADLRQLKTKLWRSVIFKAPTHLAVLCVTKRAKSNNTVLDHALWLACKRGRLPLIEKLLERGADINYSKYHKSVLDVAIIHGHTKVVNLLLVKNVNANQSIQPDIYTAAMNGYCDVVQVLLDHHFYVDDANYDNSTALWIACKNGHVDVVALLLKYNANCNVTTHTGCSAIYMAAANNHLGVVLLLRDECVDVNYCSFAYPPPLHVAIRNHHNDVVRDLLDFNCGKTCRALCVALGITIDYATKKMYIQAYTTQNAAPIQTLFIHLIKKVMMFVAPPTLAADIFYEHNGVSPVLLAIKYNNDILSEISRLIKTNFYWPTCQSGVFATLK